MMRSMYTAVSGLRTHQSKMDTIGHNIANVNTVGYKKGQVTFKEAFSQMMAGASGPSGGKGGTNPQQVGLGVGLGAITNIHTQGNSQKTDKPTDLMLDGEGFFTVSDDTGFNNRYFTRDGSFGIDSLGNLVTADGMMVLGYTFDENGEKVDTIKNIKINKSETVKPTSTNGVTFRGNLDANTTNKEETMTTLIYDSLGNEYELTFKAKKDDAEKGKWGVELSRIADTKTGNYKEIDKSTDFIDDFTLKFGLDGTIDPKDVKDIKFKSDGLNKVEFDKDKTGKELKPGVAVGGTFKDIVIIDKDKPETYRNITQFANDTDLKPYKNDGNTSGTLDGFTIDASGIVMGRFTNGEAKALGQLVLTKFDNPMGLEKLGGNLFVTTRNSGEAQYGTANTRGFGAVKGGNLEMSNVDISFEFTEMITTQRGFQANSRVITTSDEMLQELVNIKR